MCAEPPPPDDDPDAGFSGSVSATELFFALPVEQSGGQHDAGSHDIPAFSTRPVMPSELGPDGERNTDRWPELPDDSGRWNPPTTAFRADLVCRLDAEQWGR